MVRYVLDPFVAETAGNTCQPVGMAHAQSCSNFSYLYLYPPPPTNTIKSTCNHTHPKFNSPPSFHSRLID